MAIDLRLPDIKGTDKEQLKQIRSYLYQLIPELQFALNTVNTVSTTSSDTVTENPKSLITIPTMSEASAIGDQMTEMASDLDGNIAEANARIDGDIPFSDTGWIDIGIIDTNEAVMISSNDVGRGTTGASCYYRVVNGNHVYVAFNCACIYSGSTLIINKNKIPSQYCPERNAYAMVPTGGRAIVRAIVNHSGYIVIDYVQILSATANTTSADVKWIDGYIDYWI